MGNAVIPPQAFSAEPFVREPTDHNGWLIHLPVEDRSSAFNQLPQARDGEQAERFVEVDTSLGRMRIRFELKSSKHHRSRNWFWSATWADKVDG
jgi:hypothetical protein